MKNTIISTVLFGSVALGAMPAFAGSMITETVKVDLSAYNLETEEGAKAALSKIQHAAEKVCGADEPLPGSRMISTSARICVEQAVEEAVGSLTAPQLASAFEETVRQ